MFFEKLAKIQKNEYKELKKTGREGFPTPMLVVTDRTTPKCIGLSFCASCERYD